jgi:hypothetical protein
MELQGGTDSQGGGDTPVATPVSFGGRFGGSSSGGGAFAGAAGGATPTPSAPAFTPSAGAYVPVHLRGAQGAAAPAPSSSLGMRTGLGEAAAEKPLPPGRFGLAAESLRSSDSGAGAAAPFPTRQMPAAFQSGSSRGGEGLGGSSSRPPMPAAFQRQERSWGDEEPERGSGSGGFGGGFGGGSSGMRQPQGQREMPAAFSMGSRSREGREGGDGGGGGWSTSTGGGRPQRNMPEAFSMGGSRSEGWRGAGGMGMGGGDVRGDSRYGGAGGHLGGGVFGSSRPGGVASNPLQANVADLTKVNLLSLAEPDRRQQKKREKAKEKEEEEEEGEGEREQAPPAAAPAPSTGKYVPLSMRGATGSGAGGAAPSGPSASAGAAAASAPLAGGSSSAAAAAAAAAAEQVKKAAASSLGDDVLVSTFTTALLRTLEDFAANCASKAAPRKGADAIGALIKAHGDAGTLAPIALGKLLDTALPASGEVLSRGMSVAYATLLTAARSRAKPKEEPVFGDALVGSGLEAFLGRAAGAGALVLPEGEGNNSSGGGGSGAGPGEYAITLYAFVAELVGIDSEGGSDAKGRLPRAALGERAKALVKWAPVEQAEEEEGEEEEEEGGAAAAAAAAQPAAAAASKPAVTFATAPTPAAAAGGAAADPAAAAAAALEAEAASLAQDVIASGRVGRDLVAAALSGLSQFKSSDVSGHLMLAILERAHESGLRTVGKQMVFLQEDQYGALLKEYCYGKMKASCAALFAMQGFFNRINFPLGDKNVAKLYTAFAQLYEDDIITEEPMQAWRNDIRNSTPGHAAALKQTEQ